MSDLLKEPQRQIDYNDNGMTISWVFDAIGAYMRKNGRKPDYVIIHAQNKYRLLSDPTAINPRLNKDNLFGMEIIWAINIEPSQIICVNTRGNL